MNRRLLSGLPIGWCVAASALTLTACSASPDAKSDDGPTAQAQQALTTCVTIQRGTFGAVEDATIANGITYANWSPGSLRAGGSVEALIKFDVSSIPAGVSVTSATMSLTTAAPISNFSLWARYATAPWTESTVTFASFNQQMSNKSSGSMLPSAPNTTQTMTVKPSTVQGWIDGTLPNYGLVLETMVTAPSAWKDTVFVSSESPTVALRPALQVCYTTVDYCAPAPCLNGGTCTSGITGYTCACAPGYSGTNCEINVDDCAGSPCQNGGACTDGVNGYTCTCPPGYTGANCQTDIDECAPAPCVNGGVCTDHVNAYSCACPAGFTGTNCEINIDDCAGNPCQNGGTCTDGANSYTCSCAPGYTGTNCQTNIDDCIGNACQNGSTCVDGIAAYTCACAPGFTGALCQTNIDDCAGNPCQNGGTCTDGVNGYTCSCAPGYTGTNCQIDIDDCAGNPCQNGGTCVDGVNSYTCQCVPGWTGASCENPACPCGALSADWAAAVSTRFSNGFSGVQWLPIGECDISPNAVTTSAYQFTDGSFSGFGGLGALTSIGSGGNGAGCFFTNLSANTSVMIDTTDAQASACIADMQAWIDDTFQAFGYPTCVPNNCDPNNCVNATNCINDPGGPVGYICECAEGWTGTNCDVDIDECANGDPCNIAGGYGLACTNTPGSYSCQCPPLIAGAGGKSCDVICPCYIDAFNANDAATFTAWAYGAQGLPGNSCTFDSATSTQTVDLSMYGYGLWMRLTPTSCTGDSPAVNASSFPNFINYPVDAVEHAACQSVLDAAVAAGGVSCTAAPQCSPACSGGQTCVQVGTIGAACQ